MSSPFDASAQGGRGAPKLPTPPDGWPIGSYETYSEAQKAVDHLAEQHFHVEDVTIVGVDLMLVERVIGRLSWPKVLGGGALSGAWFGLLIGMLLSMFDNGKAVGGAPLLMGLISGVLFGTVFAAISFGVSRRTRDFASSSQLVAGRYDVLCLPRSAEKGRDILAKLAIN